MQRQQLRLVLGVRGGMLQGYPHSQVELSPPTIRKTLVRGVPDQRVLELEVALVVLLNELAQSLPYMLAPHRDISRQDGSEQLLGERLPQHGSAPKQRPVARVQQVDPGGDQSLDRVGQRLQALRRPGHGQQLFQEQRVSR